MYLETNRPKRLKNHILWCHTYQYILYEGVFPPGKKVLLQGLAKLQKFILHDMRPADKTNVILNLIIWTWPKSTSHKEFTKPLPKQVESYTNLAPPPRPPNSHYQRIVENTTACSLRSGLLRQRPIPLDGEQSLFVSEFKAVSQVA